MSWGDASVAHDDYADDGSESGGRLEDEWFVTDMGCLWNFCLICSERCITQPRGASKLHGRVYSFASPLFSKLKS
jgi:hypothetical protein